MYNIIPLGKADIFSMFCFPFTVRIHQSYDIASLLPNEGGRSTYFISILSTRLKIRKSISKGMRILQYSALSGTWFREKLICTSLEELVSALRVLILSLTRPMFF